MGPAAPSGGEVESDAAERLLAKVRRFVSEDLDADERAMFAALLAPAVAKVWAVEEVQGYGYESSSWSAEALPESLRDALRRGGVRLEGLEGDQPGAAIPAT